MTGVSNPMERPAFRDMLKALHSDGTLLVVCERYDRIALGGPEEIVPRFEGFLASEMRGCVIVTSPCGGMLYEKNVGEPSFCTLLPYAATNPKP